MSAGGPILNGQPADDDGTIVQTQAGLAETPMGQRVAVMITVLLPKDAALATGKAITDMAGQLSSTRLLVAQPGTNGAAQVQP